MGEGVDFHYTSHPLNIHMEMFYGTRAELLERDLLKGEMEEQRTS